jgi:hypothetical protein
MLLWWPVVATENCLQLCSRSWSIEFLGPLGLLSCRSPGQGHKTHNKHVLDGHWLKTLLGRGCEQLSSLTCPAP